LCERFGAEAVTAMVLSIASAGLGDVPVLELPLGGKSRGSPKPTMRHCSSSVQIASLPRSMQLPTPSLRLVCSSGANQAEAACSSSALGTAVSTPAIATSTDRELASAIATGADDEPVTAGRSRNWHEPRVPMESAEWKLRS
jgi:hypothetical protein